MHFKKNQFFGLHRPWRWWQQALLKYHKPYQSAWHHIHLNQHCSQNLVYCTVFSIVLTDTEVNKLQEMEEDLYFLIWCCVVWQICNDIWWSLLSLSPWWKNSTLLKMEAASTYIWVTSHSYHYESFQFRGSFIIGTKQTISCHSAVCITHGCCLTIDRCNTYLFELCNFQCAQQTGDLVVKQWNLILLAALNTSAT